MTEQRSADDTAIAQLSEAGLTGTVQTSDNGFMPFDPADQAAVNKVDALERGMASEELLQLLNKVEKDVTAWIPTIIGESLYGTVNDTVWVENDANDYGAYWMVVVETPSGKLMGFHGYHMVIAKNITQKIESGALVRGSMIAISYRGEGKAKGGRNAPKMYNMQVIGPQDS